jgi:hypothetical protein
MGFRGPFCKSFRHAETNSEVLKLIGTGAQAVCPPPAGCSMSWRRTFCSTSPGFGSAGPRICRRSKRLTGGESSARIFTSPPRSPKPGSRSLRPTWRRTVSLLTRLGLIGSETQVTLRSPIRYTTVITPRPTKP